MPLELLPLTLEEAVVFDDVPVPVPVIMAEPVDVFEDELLPLAAVLPPLPVVPDVELQPASNTKSTPSTVTDPKNFKCMAR